MPEITAHPSREQLSAYNLGQLPPDEAVAVENHISECEPCCDTIISLSSDDTFVGLLKGARQLPTDQTIDHGVATAPSSCQAVPVQLAEHPRYEILGLIGKGGMGDVYKARHRKMERTVALKVINRGLVQKPEAVDRFHREVKAAAQLSHPNIVTAHDADQAGEFHFMVMEYVDGVDLSQTVNDRGALPVAEACDYVQQAAIGLQHAHERGMVHRDIKPHNLMVTSDGTLKILDFGLASLAPDTAPDTGTSEARGDLTAAGAIMGTPDFISPEQAEDARQADIRSDIYSLGSTLYFLLSAQPPFAEGSVMHKLKSHAQSDPEPLDTVRLDVPADLAAVISRMMAKDPGERFQTPEEVAEALSHFVGDPSSLASPQRSGSVLKWLGGAALIAAAVALAAISFMPFFTSRSDGFSENSPEKARQAYADAKSELDPTNSTGNPSNAVRALLNNKHGREYLMRLDREFENFAYDGRLAFDEESAGAVFIWNRHQDDGSPHKQMLIRSFSKDRSGTGFIRGLPPQIHLRSVRLDEGQLIIAYVASDRAQDKLTIEKAYGLIPGAAYEVNVDVVDLIKNRTDWIEKFRSGKRTVGEGTNLTSKDLLVGEWRGKHDSDDEIRLALNANGTFEMVIVDPAKPQWVQKRTTGKYMADFSVSPAHLDLDGHTIYAAFDPKSEQEPEHDGPGQTASGAVGPERERAAKLKIEAIIELTDANTLHLSDIERKSRPKAFDEQALVMHRQGVAAEPRDQEREVELEQLQGDWDVIAFTQDGKKELAADKGVGMLVQIKGETITRIQAAPTGEKSEKEWGRIELNSRTNPKSIDIVSFDGPGGKLLGIYELTDGGLKLCFAERSKNDVDRGQPVERPTTFAAPAGSGRVLIEYGRNRPEVTTDTSSPRTILDQGYKFLDVGKEIGSRHLIVTESNQALSIAEEMSLALKFEGAPLGVVELNVSAVYSISGDTPRLVRATTSAKEQGALVMHGTVEFENGEAQAKWTTYKESGRKLEPPRKQQATLKEPPSGPLVLDSTIQVVGPLLLPDDGEREVVRVRFNNEAREGEPLVEYEAGCRLKRAARSKGAGFAITVFTPDSDKPEMTWEYDSQGNCESIQLTPTTVMTPHEVTDAPRNEGGNT